MNSPLVSIGLPVYNGEVVIAKSITSLLQQSYVNFELIISDNHSTDNTERICRDFAKSDLRIRYFKQEHNIGMLPNFNFLHEKVNGKYFMWAAADDEWAPTFLEEAVNVLEENPECVSVFSHFNIFNFNNGNSIENVTPSSLASNLPSLRIRRVLEELHPNLIYGLHRYNLIRDIKFEKIDWADVLIVCRIVSLGKYYIIPKVLYKIGINGNNRVPYSITGRWLNLFKFSQRYFSIIRQHSPGILSFIKNIFFLYKVVFISTLKVNKDIYKTFYNK